MLFRVLVFALLLAARSATAGNRGEHVSSVMTDPTTLTINVPIDIVGAAPERLALWRTAIDRVWNEGNDGRGFTVCGLRVRFNPQFTPRAFAERSSTTHLVIVQPVVPGQQFVSSVWHALGTSPAYSPRTGYWGSNMDAATA